uniref:Uncharacterized protein n=1 Tax=Arundo donax TaxID=35708 RepID=A0A0A8XQM7_ARUDO
MSTRLGGAPCYCFSFTQLQPAVRLRVPPARAADTSSSSSSQSTARLRTVLEQVDEALRKGNDEAALSMVRVLQGEDVGLRGFGAARQKQVTICFTMRFPYMVLSDDITSVHIFDREETDALPLSFCLGVMYHINSLLFNMICTRYLKGPINWMSLS